MKLSVLSELRKTIRKKISAAAEKGNLYVPTLKPKTVPIIRIHAKACFLILLFLLASSITTQAQWTWDLSYPYCGSGDGGYAGTTITPGCSSQTWNNGGSPFNCNVGTITCKAVKLTFTATAGIQYCFTLKTTGGTHGNNYIAITNSDCSAGPNINVFAYASTGTTTDLCYTPLTSGTYYIYCADNNDNSFFGYSFTDEYVSVTYATGTSSAGGSTMPTTANAGPDQTLCNTSSFTLAGNTPSVGTGSWSCISGCSGVTITTPTDYNSTVTGVTAATTLRWTTTYGTCTSTDNVVLTPKLPPTASAGGSHTICQTGNYTLTTGEASSSNGTRLWTENGTGSITSGSTSLTPRYTPAAGDVGNTVLLTMTVSNSPCPAATATYSITVSGTPTTANAGPDQTICSNGTFTLAGNNPTTGAGNWTCSNGCSGVTITTPGFYNSTVTGVTGSTTLVWTVSNPPCPASPDNVVLAINPPTAVTASASLACNGNPVTLSASGAITYSWSPSGSLSSVTGASVSANPTVTTTYTVTGYTTVPSCTTTAVVNVTVPTASATPGTICQGSSVTLNATGGVAYSWYPASTLTSATGATTTANPSVTTTYSVSITDVNGCTTILPATVTVYPSIPAPTFNHSSAWDSIWITPDPNYTSYQWYLDGVPIAPPAGTNSGIPITSTGNYSVVINNSTTTCSYTYTAPPIGLPIELLYFNAYEGEEYVTLLWTTASETNNEYFTIEKSQERESFFEVNRVEGAGNSNQVLNYRTIDEYPYRPVSYYRLKQTDFDGKYQYSKTVAVDFNHSKDDVLNLFPNPTSRSIRYDYYSSMDATVMIHLTDLTGKIVRNTSLKVFKGANQLSSDLGDLANGIYQLHFNCEDTNFQLVKKVVKF